MPDLPSGMFPKLNPLWNILGQPANVVNSSYPARSNLEYTSIDTLADTAAALVSGVATFVAVPFDAGNVVSKISVLVGATAASTPTHSFAAIYSGTTVAAPPLIAQSTDGTTAAIAASARFDFTLTTAQLITPAQVPYGYLWVGISVTGTAVPSLITVPTGATAGQYAWFTNTLGGTGSVLAFSATAGSALGGTAAATIATPTKTTVAPVVFLT